MTVVDNLSVGRKNFIEQHLASGAATLAEGDALDLDFLQSTVDGHDVVFHLAANPEARWGLENPRLDLEQGTIATWNVLEAMRRTGVQKLVFSSSGTMYGDTDKPCTEEDLGHLPISLYGASKFAGEALIRAFVECFDLKAWVFRFGNIVGPRGTHGAGARFLQEAPKEPGRARGARRRLPGKAVRVRDPTASTAFCSASIIRTSRSTSSTSLRPISPPSNASPSAASPRRRTPTRPSATREAIAAGPVTSRSRAWTRASSRGSAGSRADRATRRCPRP